MDKSIRRITDNLLCSACGACEAVCCRNAIHTKLLPSGFYCANVDGKLCINCGVCMRVCPSVATEEPILSNVPGLHAALCSAGDSEISTNGQSGGAVTAILLHLLNAGRIDGAVVTVLNSEGKPEAIWADTADKIRSASGSVYAQSQVIKTLLKHKNQRCAVVTLGCHSRSIKRLCEAIPSFKRPEFVIGLICGGNMSLHMKSELIRRMNLSEDAVVSFRYRDKTVGGWPGGTFARTANKSASLPKEIRMKLKPAYECYRCVLCADKMNHYSDIVVGDPWDMICAGTQGKSAIIAYTEKGRNLLMELPQDVISAEPANASDIQNGQKIETAFRNKVCAAASVASKKSWALPHLYRTEDSTEYPNIEERLFYTRRFYLSKSEAAARQLARTKIRKTERPLRERLYMLKERFINGGKTE